MNPLPTHSSIFTSSIRPLTVGLLRLGDAAAVFGAGVLAFWLRHGHAELPGYYTVAIVVGTLLVLLYMPMTRLYEFHNLESLARQSGPLVASWLAIIFTLIALGYFTKMSDSFSRVWGFYWLCLAMAGFLLLRLAAAGLLGRWSRTGRLKNNIAIVGDPGLGEKIAKRLLAHSPNSVHIVGLFDDQGGPDGSGSMSDLLKIARLNRIDEIIVSLPWKEGDRLDALLAQLNTIPVDVKLAGEAMDMPFPVRGYSLEGGLPLLNVFERPLGGWDLVVKTLEDYALAILFLIMAIPSMIVIPILIKLDSPGPVLFRQRRYGFNNNEFTVYKFRTMSVMEDDRESLAQTKPGDARVTRIGAFLRRTSLDEIPQLFNVLKGDMSIVGPRPHAVAHNKHYARIINNYMVRHKIKPGITGWAQINGLRGETDTPEKMQQRVQHDLYYIDNWSLLLDFKIILMTPFVAMVGPNAY